MKYSYFVSKRLEEALNEDIRLGNAYADALHRCEVEAERTGKPARCSLDVRPPRPASAQ